MSKKGGVVSLCDSDGNISQQKRYGCIADRKVIIDRWKLLYVLDKRKDFYINILPDEEETKKKVKK